MVSSAKAYRQLSCLKICLTIFTIYFLCTGVLFLATGIYGLIALEYFFDLSSLHYMSLTPAILCGTGGLIIISGLVGFLSAFKNNKCMLNCYGVFLTVIFAAEIISGIAAYIFMNEVQASFEMGFSNALEYYNPREKNPIDQAQKELQCCGVDSYRDWFTTTWANETRQCGGPNSSFTVPLTCCKLDIQQTKEESVVATQKDACYCGDVEEEEFVNKAGCLQILFGTSGETLHYLLAATFGMATVQLVGIIFVLCIYCKQRQIYSSKRHY